MDSFYLIVLGVATLVLIILLAFLGWNMSNAKKGTKYPVITTTCPDNWTSEKVGANILCKRPASGQFNYGSTTDPNNLTTYMTTLTSVGYVEGKTDYLNFADNKWNTDVKVPNPTCAKKAWAKTYGIKWDSVDSANYC
jgi:hypothetical protein